MDLQRSLQRINFGGNLKNIRADADTLKELCLAFVSSVPVETLDMFGGQPKVWDLKRIYTKIVDQNRGGFCYELNGLLHWMLCSLGFEVEMCKAYEYLEDAEKFMDISSHMTLLVKLHNGETWLTDIGWGGSAFVLPLNMDMLDAEQAQPNGIYRLSKMGDLYVVEKKRQIYIKEHGADMLLGHSEAASLVEYTDGRFDLSWNKIFSFSTIPCKFEDFQEGFDYAQNEHEMLRSDPIVVLQDLTKRIFILGNRFVEKRYLDPGTIQLISAKRCSTEELHRILKEKFGITIDFELAVNTDLVR